MSLAGRPPVGLGVTSGGNFYGNTAVTFTDLLGDKQISFYAQSVSQYRTTAFTYLNIEDGLQYALQGFMQDSSTTATTRRSTTRPRAVHRSRSRRSPCRASAAPRRS